MNKRILITVAIVVIIVAIVTTLNSPDESATIEETNVEALTGAGEYVIVTQDVSYYGDSVGYLAQPEATGNYPGVVMIHEWWGLNDNIKMMADNLASEGYVVLAVDLYNGEVATQSSDARTLATGVRENPDEAINNMKAAVTYLKNENAEQIASLGWCFGGQQSLQLSLNEDVDATVIYYGNLVTDTESLSTIDHPVLGIFGSEDTSIPVAQVNEFDAALDSLNIDNEIYIYDGVGHAFANPSGNNYAPDETADAWTKTLAFLERSLE